MVRLKHIYNLVFQDNLALCTHTKKPGVIIQKENLQQYIQRIKRMETIIEDLFGNRPQTDLTFSFLIFTTIL